MCTCAHRVKKSFPLLVLNLLPNSFILCPLVLVLCWIINQKPRGVFCKPGSTSTTENTRLEAEGSESPLTYHSHTMPIKTHNPIKPPQIHTLPEAKSKEAPKVSLQLPSLEDSCYNSALIAAAEERLQGIAALSCRSSCQQCRESPAVPRPLGLETTSSGWELQL